jgi:tRNA nucleotidyltransferase (CCA-adding enzyme)
VVEILRKLEEAGHETWCVGGAIRDALLGNTQQDVDLATAAPPEVVRQLFRRTAPVGLAHGTVGVLEENGTLHEVTTFRRDVQTDGRHAIVEFGVSLDDDLARRDFTINAIAYHPLHRQWRDPFRGHDDLRRGVLRAVGEPAERFREDRLRILRALRFTARFALAIDPVTWAAAVDQAADTGHLSAERIRDEWVKGIGTARSPEHLARLWRASGVAAVWLPELTDDPPAVALPARPDPVLVTALFCTPCAAVWRRLKGSTAEIRRAEAIDRGPAAPASGDPRDVRRWMAQVDMAADDLAMLAHWRGGDATTWPDEVERVRARGEATSRGALAVRGEDLLTADIPAGPEVGMTLQRLLDRVVDDPSLNTRDQLLALARQRA